MAERSAPYFTVRGIVLTPPDVSTWDWPRAASEAGLNTIALHGPPDEIVAFLGTGQGAAYLERCAALDLQVEYELHAVRDLLPRDLFARDPAMFRMDEYGERVPDWNLCVRSPRALEVVCERAVAYAEALRPTTGRYFFWIDDGQPMCRCPQCRGLSESDQALILENALLGALRRAAHPVVWRCTAWAVPGWGRLGLALAVAIPIGGVDQAAVVARQVIDQ